MYMRILFFTLVIYVTCSIALAQQPQAQFQASITSGCAPLVVNFQNLSTGYVSSQWITGAGNSSLANPGIFYPNPGTFSVTLVVTSAQGLKDTLTLPDYIHVYAYPVAQFSASATQVCAHEPVSFTDFSSPGSGAIVSRVWDFGDGDTSHLVNPTHAFTEPGVYPVSLVVENQYGCSDNIVYTSYITVGAPDPAFSGDNLVGCGPPLQVQFTAATSGVQHFWDFGDGATSGAAAPSHTYTSFGAFTVMHIAIGSDGCRDTLIKPTYINIGVNTLGISAQSQEICMNDTIFFHTNAASNSSVLWQFGDGGSGSGLSPSHIYHIPGSYQATATISDVSGCATTLSLPITVHSFPTTDFTTAGPTSACEVPFTVNFLHQSSGGTSFYWEFGDGYTSNLPNPSHTYTSIDS
ncbi:MAG: PKD domain-containing protein, partial [Bacteroidetes bacterium]